MADEYGIGDAQQFLGGPDTSAAEGWNYIDPYDIEAAEGWNTGPGFVDTSGAEGWSIPSGSTSTSGSSSFNLGNFLKSFGGKALDFAQTPQGIMALLGAILGRADRQPAIGGGARAGYAGPKQMTRTMTQGAYGPIARYAANGGIMHAYANGGVVQMEDGGFVMTKKAVDGAGGPQGIKQLIPGARMIGGPPDPTGKRDLTPAVINGPRGQTPAKVSQGEAYFSKRVVAKHGGSEAMYDKMHALERRA